MTKKDAYFRTIIEKLIVNNWKVEYTKEGKMILTLHFGVHRLVYMPKKEQETIDDAARWFMDSINRLQGADESNGK